MSVNDARPLIARKRTRLPTGLDGRVWDISAVRKRCVDLQDLPEAVTILFGL
jgi:hypothetical protein